MIAFGLAILSTVASAIYLGAVVALAAYGLHSLWLLIRFTRHCNQVAPPSVLADEPAVLVQLPVYNERDVVERLVAAVGQLDWPADRLRIQLLDDSSDDTVALGTAAIEALRQRGLDAVQVRRADRTGYKAGALDHGLTLDAAHADGAAPFVAIFDADFVPAPDFLRRGLSSLLADDRCAFVQGRWEHLNPSASLLTRAQAVGIDGHFAIEQGARAWSGLALNFNGTCGVWRRSAIEHAGGWRHDTLTEDLDLSYRAHLAGWRAAYRLDLAVPGELPPTLDAWRAQQFRWAKGSLQTARKLLPSVWRAPWSLPAKLGATFHLTHYLVHPLILLSLLMAPLAVPTLARVSEGLLIGGAALLACGMLPPLMLYIASQRVLGRGWRALTALPALTALGTGIAVSNTCAAWEALRGSASAFVRTPKQGDGAGSYRAAGASGLPELAAASWGLLGLVIAWFGPSPWIAPILALYVLGFAHHGGRLFWTRVVEQAGEDGRPWWQLLPLGTAALAVIAVLAWRDTSWREEPVLFATGAVFLGVICVLGLSLARTRRLPPIAIGWILAVGVGLNVLGMGLWHSDDVNRYAVEGAQIQAGQNPYVVPPADPAALALVPAAISERVNHPHMTAVYPPAALLAHAGIQALVPGISGFTAAAFLGSLAAIGLTLALMLRHGVHPGLIIAVAWNPVLPIFASGEAHNDILMAVGILIALLLASHAKRMAALACLTVAVLAKPFAIVLLPLFAERKAWRMWWVMPLIATALYLPFLDAGYGLFASLLTFGGSMHFHGALDPWIRIGLEPLLAATHLEFGVRVVLLSLLAGGLVWLWRRRAGIPLPTLAVRMLGVLLLCVPTLHPWYFIALVVLLPFARTYALTVWTAAAGVYWLHGLAMLDTGGWTESLWVTGVAHLPAVGLIVIELFGPEPERRPTEPALALQRA